MTRGQPFTTEWRAEKSAHLDLARVVIQHGLAADLIVAGQADSDLVRFSHVRFSRWRSKAGGQCWSCRTQADTEIVLRYRGRVGTEA
jgi:hypothetical protein